MTTRDYRDNKLIPSMQELSALQFSFTKLDEKLLCPRSTMSLGQDEGPENPYPVLMLQVNLLRDGVILTISGCHSVMDMIGQAHIIRMLSKACYGEAPTEEEILSGNIDRCNIIPLLKDGERKAASPPENARSAEPAISSESVASASSKDPVWACVSFQKEALSNLKSLASADLPGDTTFVSTDDCICAVTWQSLAGVQMERMDGSENLTFSRLVESRKYVGIPATYIGNIVANVSVTFTLKDLVQMSSGKAAAALRSKLNPEELSYDVRARTTDRARPSTQVSAMASVPQNKIGASSWSKADLADVDFKLGFGKPLYVTRPLSPPMEGVVILLPKNASGDIQACICLRSDDMEGLRKDKHFCEFATFLS